MALDVSLLNLMQNLTPAVVATVNEGKPYTTFITWLIAKDENTLRMAVSTNATTTNNIRQNPNVSIEVFGEGIASSIVGEAKVIKEEIENIPFPVAVIEVKVKEVINNLFPGATVKGTIPFEHTGNIEKAEELDSLVLKALKE
ncbi:MAG: pyridoxamine 5'-phosphate oxidase [Hydrogenothermus sp.]|nr:MAG: pyridoxamine 5'-phosphate oxidase [Hydrogenothermus sp.]